MRRNEFFFSLFLSDTATTTGKEAIWGKEGKNNNFQRRQKVSSLISRGHGKKTFLTTTAKAISAFFKVFLEGKKAFFGGGSREGLENGSYGAPGLLRLQSQKVDKGRKK